MLTKNVTDRVEANFYARCPPEKRPASYQNSSSSDASTAHTKSPGKYAYGRNITGLRNLVVAAADDSSTESTSTLSAVDGAFPKTKSSTPDREEAHHDSSPYSTSSVSVPTSSKTRKARWWTRPGTGETPLNTKGEPKYDQSLLFALNTTFFGTWWYAGLLRLCSGRFGRPKPFPTRLED